MRSSHTRLQDDLRGLVEGEVHCDDVTRAVYASDAGIYTAFPSGVVFPKSVNDVAVCLQYAASRQIPVHPRGAGTGRSGGCVGRGIVLDMTRFMRRLVQTEATTVRVQAGATLARVNSMLGRHQGRGVGLDAGPVSATTFGSLIATDGAGPRWLRDGFPHQHIIALQAVLASGAIIELDRATLPKRSVTESDTTLAHGVALARSIIHRGHATLVDTLHDLIANTPSSTTTDAMSYPSPPSLAAVPRRGGYHTRDIIGRDHSFDLLKLLAGSEGTLAVITEMTLATTPLPRVRVGAVFGCASLERAARAAAVIRSCAPSLCTMLDRRQLVLLGESFPPFQPLFGDLRETEASLMVELCGDDRSVLADRFADLATTLTRSDLTTSARFLLTTTEVELFDRLGESLAFALLRMPHAVPLVPLFDDLVVPMDEISPTITLAQNLFRKYGMTFALGGHWGQGQLAIHPILTSLDDATTHALVAIADELYGEIWSRGGSIASAQSLGRARTPWLARQEPLRRTLFADIKAACDPNAILNPGCIIDDGSDWRTLYHHDTTAASDDATLPFLLAVRTASETFDTPASAFPSRASDEVAAVVADSNRAARRRQLQAQLKWDSESPEIQELEKHVHRCARCGLCRSRGAAHRRMCPTFRIQGMETSSPRACVNLLRHVVASPDALELLTTARARAIAELCLHCQTCRVDCPAHVDLPQLAFRIKAAWVAAHGLSSGERLFVHLDSWLKLLSWVSCPVNWSLSNRTMRWIFEKLFGLPQQRRLPSLAKIPFTTRVLIGARRAIRWSGDADRPKVALFIDTYVNHFAPALARAAVAVLEHNGIDVHVPLRQVSSGLVAFACGDADTATTTARRNTRLLAGLVRQGYTIVTVEPASATCLTTEYRYIADALDHRDDLDLVASTTLDLTAYLWHRYELGELRTDFVTGTGPPQTIAYHAPCRSLASIGGDATATTPAESLLRIVPGFDVRRVEKGCCGLGNTYGLRQKSYATSLRMAMPIVTEIRSLAPDVVATECNLCRLQLEQVYRHKIAHPVALLAEAYGIKVDG